MADNNGSNKLLQAFFAPAVAMMNCPSVEKSGKFNGNKIKARLT